MHEVLVAAYRALRDLGRSGILWQALWPPLAAFLGWSVVAYWTWTPLSAWLAGHLPDWSWMSWLGSWLAHAAVLLTFAPVIYFTAVLLVAVVALPRMMDIVAAGDYPDVSRHGSTTAAFWGSLGNTLAAGAVFLVGWLLCLPLLLVPGGLLILPLLWSAWLNQRTFRYDVLALHATDAERRTLFAQCGGQFRLAGFLAALAAHVPIANVLAPAFSALLFSHLGLSGLRRLRRAQGIDVSTTPRSV